MASLEILLASLAGSFCLFVWLCFDPNGLPHPHKRRLEDFFLRGGVQTDVRLRDDIIGVRLSETEGADTAHSH